LNAFGNAANTASWALDMGLLEKATICILDKDMQKNAKYPPFKVQFNPQSYSIRRGVRLSSMQPMPQAEGPTNFVSVTAPEKSYLMVQLVFDSYTEYGLGQSLAMQSMNLLFSHAANQPARGLDSLMKKDEETVHTESLDACQKFIDLIRIDGSKHEVKYISFVWGPMNFIGAVSGLNVDYTMFTRMGDPVRTTVGLIIAGDEARNLVEAEKRTNLQSAANQAAGQAKTLRPRSAGI
jgi:hypothetical protein